MVSLSKSKTLFFPTSPRTPFKIINEIKLLVDNFTGVKWDKDKQKAYASLLAKADFFEGEIKENDDFGARDRINRAPKALGFVNLNPIEITSIGKRLLSQKRLNETFTRQFMKFQLPSPFHKDSDGRYNVRPYLELLRLIRDLDGLSKHEIAMFGLQLINIDRYDDIVQEIKKFRKAKSELKYTKKREFIFDYFKKVVGHIYAEEISEGSFDLRETDNPDLNTFIQTKKSNLIDYADACIRYLKATGLVSFNVQSLRISMKEDKTDDLNFLLETIPRESVQFKNETEYKTYLFDDSNVTLFTDNPVSLISKLKELGLKLIKNKQLSSLPDFTKLGIEQLKDLLEQYEEMNLKQIVTIQRFELQTYKEFDNILEVYQKIMDGDTADPSLIFEWNTWRALTMLDDGKINGNFKIDTDGSPLFTAPAKVPDIECDYSDFSMTIEVTLSYGNKQYDMEGEPVARHLSDFEKKTKKESYCLFVAPKISQATLAHFFILHCKKVAAYGGYAKIIPIDLEVFVKMLYHAKKKTKVSSKDIKKYVSFISEKAKKATDENEWYNIIKETSENWTAV